MLAFEAAVEAGRAALDAKNRCPTSSS
jgi:hypothetical protein